MASPIDLPPSPPGDTPELPPIWFATPDGFFGLPLADTAEERVEGAKKFVRALYAEGDESIWSPGQSSGAGGPPSSPSRSTRSSWGGAGTGVDVVDKGIDIGSSVVGSEAYGDLKDSWEDPLVEVGSKW